MSDNMNDAIPLREFMERLLTARDRATADYRQAHDREHAAIQRSIDVAATLAASTKADANEWRAAMTDRERTFVRYETIEAMQKDISDLKRANAQLLGALSVARFVGFGGLMTGLGGLVWIVTRGGTPI